MIRTTRRPLLVLIFGAAVFLAACGSSGSKAGTGAGDGTTTTAGSSYNNGYGNSGATTTTVAPTTTAAAGNAVVSSATTALGATLVDADGHTLYEYQPDPSGKSTCTGGCATAWPPLTTTATSVRVGSGLTASLFTTVAGENGAKVVAVNGHALYRFAGDKKAGDASGQGFGGVWHAASPNGDPKM